MNWRVTRGDDKRQKKTNRGERVREREREKEDNMKEKGHMNEFDVVIKRTNGAQGGKKPSRRADTTCTINDATCEQSSTTTTTNVALPSPLSSTLGQ